MECKKISNKLLKRLPTYLSYIRGLPEQTAYISATQMARALGWGDVMVRKDLAKVSDGGRRKLGYIREKLMADIEEFLDVSSTTCAIIVGAGKLGQALLGYDGFEESGMHIAAGFDICPPEAVLESGKPIYPMSRLATYCEEHAVRIGIITVPACNAQSVCDALVACGIEAIWNFTPACLTAPSHVVVQNENLAVSLTALRMKLREKEKNAIS